MSGRLPLGWIWGTLGEVFTVNPPGVTSAAADDSLVSFVPMPAVEAMTGRLNAGDGKRFTDVKKGLTPFSEGDLLFAKITPSMENGKIAVAKGLIGGIGFGSTEFHVARPHAEMASEYLLFFLMQQAVRDEAKSNMTGTAGQRRVPTDYFASLPFPLPPLPEQRRIVEEIEKQFTRLDAAVEALRAAQAKLKRYRASVLNAAVTGRLVPTEASLARAEGRDYEHASTLLERIAKERQAEEERNKPRRKRPKPAPVDTSSLPELPEGWTWARLAHVSEVQGGIQKQPKRRPLRNAFPFLRVANVLRGRLDLREVHEIELFSKELETLRLVSGDLLIVEGNGSPSQIGRMAIWKGEITNCVHQNHIIRARPSFGIDGGFIEMYWNSPRGSSRVLDVASSTSGLYTLSTSKVGYIPISLPPLAEQRRIVAEVERRLSGVQQAEAAVEANLKRAERLRQAILKRAFEGRLVPQDPDDEPAAVLLERIRTEKASKERERRGSRRISIT